MPLKDKDKRKEYNMQYNLKNKEKIKQCKLQNKEKYECQHGRIQSRCVDCDGCGICEHKRVKYQCVDCEGNGICSHGRRKTYCSECGGSQICDHGIIKSTCRECEGSRFCNHNIAKRTCKECNPILYIVNLQRKSIYRIMKQTNLEKSKPSIEYLGCSAEYFRDYLKSKMTEEMTFDNIHYDHIKPVSVFNLEIEDDILDCCHYTNFQPLFAKDNLCKSSKWNEEDEVFWNENIKGKEYLPLYFPRG